MAGDFFVVRRGATAVPNQLVHNKDLSYAALALLLVTLSLPPGARAGYRELTGRGMGEKATRQALRELESMNYRFRFTHRRQGQLRDLTIVSDVPLRPADAFAEAQRMMLAGGFAESMITACSSHPEFVIQDPATSAPDDKIEGKTAGRTVQCSTVARSGTAQVSKDTFKESSLRSDSLTHQPSGRALRVVGGEEEQTTVSDVAPAGPSAAPNWNLISKAIPHSHRKGLRGKAAHRVSEVLEMLIASGWTARRINERLADNPLPPAVRNPPGLLISRLDALKELPAPSKPAGLLVDPSGDDSPPNLPVLNYAKRVEALKSRNEALRAFKEKYSTQNTQRTRS